jgi:tetratricopeptide (TPR) repeat protein
MRRAPCWRRAIAFVVLSAWGLVFVTAEAAPKSTPDESELRKADELMHDSDRLYEEGKYREGIPLTEEACSIFEKELGKRSAKLAVCLNDLAALYQRQGEFEEAEPLFKRALAIREKALGSEHPLAAVSLNNLAVLYQRRGEYGKAEPLLERALAIRERTLGPDHPEVATSLNNLALLYQQEGKYRKARPLYERALAIREKMLGPGNPEIAASLNNLAGLYQDQGEYGKAKPLFERALAIRKKALGSNHPSFAASLNNLALLYEAQGEYGQAAPLYERALATFEKTLSPEHPEVAISLNNLAEFYRVQGEYGKAKPLHERALAIREKVLGPDHPSVAASLNNLAGLYQDQGEYGKAEPLYERVLAILEKAFGHEHPHVAQSLNNLALLYDAQGEYGKAEPLLEQALTIKEMVLGPDHPLVAQSLNNLAELYRTRGEYEKAEPHFARALAIWEKALGPDHPEVATGLNNLAGLYLQQGEYGKAEPHFERALAIREKVLGPEHVDVAQTLNNLAALYRAQGKYGKAEPHFERALAIREKALGPEHVEIAKSLNNLASLHIKLGRYDSAVEFHRRALDIQEKNLTQILVFAEEHRRLAYAATLSYSIDNALSSHLQSAPEHHPSAELALTTLLRRKGLVLDMGARSVATIRRSLPEEHQHLLDELSATRDRYTALSNRGLGSRSFEQFAEQLAEIQQEQHQLWREVDEHSPLVETLSKPVTIADIQRTLPPDAVLVEFIRYYPRHQERGPSTRADPRYAAYLVFPDHFDWVDLGPAEPIEQDIKAFRRALQLKQAVPTDLHEAVMQSIVERLSDARRLFIAPDAALNLVPFGALFDGKQYLVERYDLHYLTTGRDLLRPWDANPTTDDTVMVVANPTGVSLPGTEREAELLANLFPHVETLLHDSATEAGAQRRAQPWVLHLATHGFFKVPEPDPKLEARMDEYVLSMSPSALPFAPGRLDNPMLHSGLLLASADTPADADAEADDENITADGRLTAYEISGWDLRGTELVVLSACGTGLGEPRAGEGVLGLRRAFAMAGAQAQVMSLWDVSDATTAKLMEAYYRKLLAGKGRAEAMQEVQLELLRSGEHHPGDWASFVVVGEWRPLSKERLPEPEGPPPIETRGCGCQRASIGGDGQPPGVLLLGLLGVLGRRRGSPSKGHLSSRAKAADDSSKGDR